jgi:hypothetical protein
LTTTFSTPLALRTPDANEWDNEWDLRLLHPTSISIANRIIEYRFMFVS